jgi:leader peptidase (prepilin peptidase)/N-methyltransferase
MIRDQIRIWGTGFAALLGLAFGSFLNVCLSRWPEGESIVHPRSHCRKCGRTLAWWENVPLVSWLALRGRCRTCGIWIGWRYVIVEAAVSASWAAVAWISFTAFFPFIFCAGMMFFMWTLIALAALDAEHLWLPDALTLPSIAVGVAWWFIQSQLTGPELRVPIVDWSTARELGLRFVAILSAAALILAIRWLYWLVRRREGLGLGDAKLMAMLAAWLGFSGALLAFGIGVVSGALFALVVLAVPQRGSQQERWALLKMPLGTFLCIGGIISALWGQPIIAAYLRWAGF